MLVSNLKTPITPDIQSRKTLRSEQETDAFPQMLSLSQKAAGGGELIPQLRAHIAP